MADSANTVTFVMTWQTLNVGKLNYITLNK